jgi:acyl-CoA thioester hydrolase
MGMRFHEQVHGVYFDDLDAFGILHNARFIVLFERTIGSFWRHLGWGGLIDAQLNPDQYHLVRSNHLEYLRPVQAVAEVRARVWVEKLGRTSLTFGFALLPMDHDAPYATGTRTVVRVDPTSRRPAEWTQAVRDKLAPYRKDLDRPMLEGPA